LRRSCELAVSFAFLQKRPVSKESFMHTPNPGSDPRIEDEDEDVRQPPVPPDQDDVVPVSEPPQPGRGKDAPPLIAALHG